MLRRFVVLSLGLAVGFLGQACSDDDPVVAPPTMDIVETASSAGFSALVTAVQAAGLTQTLKEGDPITVFAPTDAAFAKLPAGTLVSLLLPENRDQLVSILTYHVIQGEVLAEDIVHLSSVPTVEGGAVTFRVDNGTVRVDDATVVQADVLATNGVIHVIDTVILP